jgi:hypothetical protein
LKALAGRLERESRGARKLPAAPRGGAWVRLTNTRVAAWIKEQPLGVEFADVVLESDRLTATGVAIGSSPMPYRLDYTLDTIAGFVTSRMHVIARGQGWKRGLDLQRSTSGTWTATRNNEGVYPASGDGELPALVSAVDCDLGLSPLTNSMPVLRNGFLEGGGSLDFVMAWISVPDLSVHESGQRYTFIRAEGAYSVIRYEATDSDFAADITFDRDGLVVEYPGIGSRIQTR